MNFLNKFWNAFVRIIKILNVSIISIITVFLLWLLLFNVEQVTDAIIALGEFGSIYHFIILIFICCLLAFFIWYWARVFYYIEYNKRIVLTSFEKIIVICLPRILGFLLLLIVGIACICQSSKCCIDSFNYLLLTGILLVVLSVVFLAFVIFRRKIFKLPPIDQLHDDLKPANLSENKVVKRIVPLNDLPLHTRRILIITTAVSSLFLVFITITPIYSTMIIGDAVSVLLACFCIWIPILYWIRYFSLKIGFPLYLLLTVLILIFSFFNGNKDIRFVSNTSSTNNTVSLENYTKDWLNKSKEVYKDKKAPMFIVLSEGGGIRAAYWSSQFLARTQRDYPNFRNQLFCISGVSGGSFGATVFDGLLSYYDSNKNEESVLDSNGKNVMQNKITDIIGKDFLSPTIACLCTREVFQLLIPIPIESFDCAKTFEKTWEYVWKKNLNGDTTFSNSFLSLMNKKSIPPLFINTTQVENGYPVILSNIKINYDEREIDNNTNQNNLHLPREFYSDILGNTKNDTPLSTASLLSARFPYVSPAGTMKDKNNNVISLVDGGYFDNTGANTAYQVMFNIKKIYEMPTDFKPIIIYLKNGISQADSSSDKNKTLIDQLLAPIQTSLQIRDSNTKNNLEKLCDFVSCYDGELITYTLPKPGDTETDIPLGWALSKRVQMEIDSRVEEIDISAIAKYLK